MATIEDNDIVDPLNLNNEPSTVYYDAKVKDIMDYTDITNRTFSGTDIACIARVPGNKTDYPLNNLQTISISSYRDTTPVRALGLDCSVTYVQGTKTISGSLVFTKTNFSPFDKMIQENNNMALADTVGYQATDKVTLFDIHIYKATEYGDHQLDNRIGTYAVLKGVALMTNGLVMSVNDVYTETTFNYLANQFIDFNLSNQAERMLDNEQKASSYYKDFLLRINT